MDKFIFSNFLTDESEYTKAEQYWEALFKESFDDVYRLKSWVIEYGVLLGNGSKLKDGNPLISAQSKKEKKYVRIVLLEPSSSEPNFIAWIKEDDVEGYVDLSISSAVSSGTEHAAKAILSKFLNESPSVDAMKKFIESTCRKITQSGTPKN